jgi:hypothetical protein
MVLDHIAAILLFSGPLFYIGLWMALDPAGIAALPQSIVGVSRHIVRGLCGQQSREIGELQPAIPRRLRIAVRFVGVVIVLLAIAV